MQRAKNILSILRDWSVENSNYVFNRLYRNLFNQNFYLEAYAKIYAKEGNMTAGIDEETIDGFNLEKVNKIIELMKKEQYCPKPVLRKYRPLGIPTFEDKLVQEVVRQILEAIYEPIFLDYSHAFRPNRSCHTALYQIKNTCKGTNWVVEGDIEGFFDNINHEILISLLEKKINDGRFIRLIKRFLKAGYLEFKQVHNSLSGVPQSEIISPILSNVYLHELDKFMMKTINEFEKNTIRKKNPEYQKLNHARFRANKRREHDKVKELLHQMRNLNSQDQMDNNYIKVKYTRYANDFLVNIIGSKELATNIRESIHIFLEQNLKLNLNFKKILITNLSNNRVKFLGYEISKTEENSYIYKNTRGIEKCSANGTMQLLVPREVIEGKLKPFTKNNKSTHYSARANIPVLDIINEYNSEIRRLYNYYSLATDVSTKLGKFKFYHYYSLAKTIALKEKCSVKKVIDKYGIEVPLKQGTGTRKIIGFQYQVKNETKSIIYFNESLSKKELPIIEVSDR